jgi:signal transduction histidine kinase
LSGPVHTLAPGGFAAAFPFHVVFSMAGEVLQVGEVLQRIAPDIRPGAALREVLRPAGATPDLEFADLLGQPNLVVLLNHAPSGLMLRGAIHALGTCPEGPHAFLGSPWLQTADDLVRFGLVLTDFAAHDATSDVMQLAAIHRLAQDDLRRLNQLQRAQQMELNALLELSPDGIIAFNREGTRTHLNASLQTLLGPLLHDGGDRQLAMFDARLRAATAQPHLFASCLELADGSRDTLELVRPRPMTLQRSVRDVKGSDGLASGRVVYLRDITHEAEVDRMKTEFLSTAAHELRTPLASIHGFTELMLAHEGSPDLRREMLGTMHRQSTLLVKLVNELLDLARIEARAGKDLRIERVALNPLLEEIVAGFRMEEQACRVVTDLPSTTAWVNADRAKLTQAVLNVLSNAEKYSPSGGQVALNLAMRAGTRGPETGIRIRDQGIGMNADQLARIFERFFRANPGGVIPGTGLGMTLVKEFVELMGGEVCVDSAPGEGTTVTLWLPCWIPPGDAMA